MFCSKCGVLGFRSRGDESESHLQQKKNAFKSFQTYLVELCEITNHWMDDARHVEN